MAGAQHDGAAGAQQLTATGSQHGSGLQQRFFRCSLLLRRLNRRNFGRAHGSGAQHGSGAGQQTGAGAGVQQTGAGAQQVGAGAQQLGAGAAQGSGQQADLFLKQSNNPASAD